MLALAEREEIALAQARGEGVRAIVRLIGRDPSVISRGLAGNTSKRGYRATNAPRPVGSARNSA
uniref:helix-turn-helix domain-containing protein n=1 Tax=Nocardiopsis alba TaxID=53437 RepID=UPI000A003DF3